MSSTAPLNVVQLGRYGDIINILPMIEYRARTRPVNLFVAAEFSLPFIDLPYCTTHALPLPFNQVRAAIEHVSRLEGELLVSQVWGDHQPSPRTPNFCFDSWSTLSEGEPRSSTRWEFGRPRFTRCPVREAALLSHIHVPEGGVLVNLSGQSAPMAGAHSLFASITRHLPHIVNLGALRAERLQDFLGLYDRWRTLITVDTATLHLAKNHPGLRIVQLRPDHGWDWSKAPRMPNAIRVLGYDEAVRTADQWLPPLRSPL